MKKVLVIKKLLIALCLSAIATTGFGQINDADPAITSFSFAASPIQVGNTTTLTVFFINNGFTTPIAAGSVGLKLSLPTSGEYKANPEGTPALSGTFLSKFTWTYNTGTKSFFGTSNQAIAPGDGGTVIVNIKGFIPVASAISIANIQRLNPAAYPNENVNNNNLTAALGVIPGSPVPIQLLNFTATKQAAGTVLLNWQTTSEINSKSFDVQYSKDGTQWQTLGTVAAAGTSSTQKSYSFVHNTPANGINYYQLKQIDLDANFKMSLVRTVTFSTGGGVKVLPNPVVDRVYVTTTSSINLESVIVYSAEGKQVERFESFALGNGIDMSRYSAGTYMLKIIDKQGNTELRTIFKR